MNKMERRSFVVEGLEADNDSGKIRGHAAVFNMLSQDLGGFKEKIKPGAFARAIREKHDVRALWNHNADYVLGRTKSGTLSIVEDERGLLVEIDMPDTQWANDLRKSIKRGDVDQMSFGFYVGSDDWKMVNDELVREIIEVKELFDVSPVTYPAYTQTDVSVRSFSVEEIKEKAAALRAVDNGQNEQPADGAALPVGIVNWEESQERNDLERKRLAMALIEI